MNKINLKVTIVFCISVCTLLFSQNKNDITNDQRIKIMILSQEKGLTDFELSNYVINKYNIKFENLNQAQADMLIYDLEGDKYIDFSKTKNKNLNDQKLSSPSPDVLADVLEVGMSKLFYLVDGGRISGEITKINDGKCTILTIDGQLVVPMTDILEESVDLIKKDDIRYKGPILREDSEKLIIRSTYGDVTIKKQDIEKLDRYHGGQLVAWKENKKVFYEGEAKLTALFLDPTAFSLNPNTFYVSGLSVGYGFTERFMLTTKFMAALNNDINLHPKMRFLHNKTATKETALTWGMGIHKGYPIPSLIGKYSHAFIVDGNTKLNEYEKSTSESLNNSSIINILLGDDDYDERSTYIEAYLVYSSKRKNPSGRGKVGYSVGFKTSNAFSILENTDYKQGSLDTPRLEFNKKSEFYLPFRLWANFEYDLNKKMKFLASMWLDNGSRSKEFSDVVDDYFGNDNTSSGRLDSVGGEYSIFDIDFGFLYAVNENLRIEFHFQQPYLGFYWEFFEF